MVNNKDQMTTEFIPEDKLIYANNSKLKPSRDSINHQDWCS